MKLSVAFQSWACPAHQNYVLYLHLFFSTLSVSAFNCSWGCVETQYLPPSRWSTDILFVLATIANCQTCHKRLSKSKYINFCLCKLSCHSKCLRVADNTSADGNHICKDCLGNELPFYHLEEKKLLLALCELSHLPSFHWDTQTLSSLKFNPFDSSNDYASFNASCNDSFCDTDDKAFTGVEEMIKCKYCVEDGFISHEWLTCRIFLAVFEYSKVTEKLGFFSELFEFFSHLFYVLVLSEIWLNESGDLDLYH